MRLQGLSGMLKMSLKKMSLRWMRTARKWFINNPGSQEYIMRLKRLIRCWIKFRGRLKRWRKAMNPVSVLRGHCTGEKHSDSSSGSLWLKPLRMGWRNNRKCCRGSAPLQSGCICLINTLREKTEEIETLCNSPNNSE